MRALAVGSSAVRPSNGRACAGWIIEGGGVRLLLDCGPGVLAALPGLFRDEENPRVRPEIDAILVSHAHPDHWLDLIMWRQALRYGPESRPGYRLRVLASAYTIGRIVTAADAVGGTEGFFPPDVALERFDEVMGCEIGDLVVTFCRTAHTEPCWAMRIEGDGQVVVYTADTGPSDDVTRFAAGADLLVSECTLFDRVSNEDAVWHLSPEEAGEMAARSGAGKLVLTHYFDELEPEDMRLRAAATFGGEVALAREGEWYACD